MSISRRAITVLLCLIILTNTAPARADSLQTTGHEIVGGIVAVAAAIAVVTIILVVHHKSASVKGCVSSGPNGLRLSESSNKSIYDLAGETSNLKVGDLVKVKGKKKHGKGSADSTFTVEELSKDYGACPATPNP